MPEPATSKRAPLPDLELSVVIPVYKNRDTLLELHRRLCRVLEEAGIRFELIFVDDACPEDSLTVLEGVAAQDARLNLVFLADNLGQQGALLTGMNLSDGQAVAFMDADLQDPPETLPVLYRALQTGHEVVFAGRRGRYETGPRLFTSKLYKWMMHRLTGIPADAGIFLVMKKEMVKKLLALNVRHVHLVPMIGLVGNDFLSLPVERMKRSSGVSTYTSWMRLRTGFQAALWVLGWRLGLRSGREAGQMEFPVREMFGAKFNRKAGGSHDRT